MLCSESVSVGSFNPHNSKVGTTVTKERFESSSHIPNLGCTWGFCPGVGAGVTATGMPSRGHTTFLEEPHKSGEEGGLGLR